MKTYHQEKAAQTVHQARGPMSVDGRGNVSQELTPALYARTCVWEKKGLSLLSPSPVATSLPPLGEPWFPPQSAKGSKGGGRGHAARTWSYLCSVRRNQPHPGTRLQKSWYKIPRILYQVSPDAAAVCALFLPDNFSDNNNPLKTKTMINYHNIVFPFLHRHGCRQEADSNFRDFARTSQIKSSIRQSHSLRINNKSWKTNSFQVNLMPMLSAIK